MVEELGEPRKHLSVIDLSVPVDHVGPAGSRQVRTAFSQECGDLRERRFSAGLGSFDVEQQTQTFLKKLGRGLVLIFGLLHSALPFGMGLAMVKRHLLR